MSELSVDFVVHAIGQLVLVLDRETLMMRMGGGGATARCANKAIESSLSEELEGYLLVARRVEGWDAVLALLLALDRDHRSLLERVLDRCAAVASAYTDDLDALIEVLTEDGALADSVEAEREARRAERGYIEPCAAKAFLALARGPFTARRDPITRAYFRELVVRAGDDQQIPPELREALAGVDHGRLLAAPPPPVIEALRLLDDDTYAKRMAELAYLANVLAAGATDDGERYTPLAASTAAIAIVQRALAARGATEPAAIAGMLRATECDRLFREAMQGGAGVSGS